MKRYRLFLMSAVVLIGLQSCSIGSSPSAPDAAPPEPIKANEPQSVDLGVVIPTTGLPVWPSQVLQGDLCRWQTEDGYPKSTHAVTDRSGTYCEGAENE